MTAALLRPFLAEPEPLSPRERRIAVTVGIVAALSRLLAVARTMWEWDEAQFAMGVREYDVVLHHPHPPGYPLFIFLGKLVHLAVHNEFRAVQIVVIAGAMAVYPALFLLARELRFPFTTCVCAAALFAFLPNVWYYGGTAFSDVPAIALGMFACAYLLRGCRDRRAYVIGAVLLGLAAGIRPQSLLLGFAPAIVATICRTRESWRDVALTIAAGGAVVLACYGGAALASESPRGYLDAVHGQSEYVSKVDSYHNPGREPLHVIARRFFLYPFDGRGRLLIMAWLAGLSAVASIALRRPPVLWAMAIFVPVGIFAWLMLDAAAVSRYAIGYFALYALLTADALRVTRVAQAPLAAILIISCIIWTLPALNQVRKQDAPNVAVLKWATHNVKPERDRLFVHTGLGPFADVYLGRFKYDLYETTDEIPMRGDMAHGWWLYAGPSASRDAINFVWKRGQIWRIARQRYFESSAEPMTDVVRFTGGWYDAEETAGHSWRWMGQEGSLLLPPLKGRAKVMIHFLVPVDIMPSPPSLEVHFNGALVEKSICATQDQQRTWEVTPRADGWNELKLTMSATANPAKLHKGGDARELGLELREYAWTPATR